jgi:dUTP pyrophosphatase
MPLPHSVVNIRAEKTEKALILEQRLGISWDIATAHEYDAGYDVRAAILEPVIIFAKTHKMIPIGLKFQILNDPFWEIQVRSRSGLAAKQGVFVLNSPGTIDYLYRQEVQVILFNNGTKDVHINPGDRIAQICVRPIPQVNFHYGSVQDSERGGFGSSGIS